MTYWQPVIKIKPNSEKGRGSLFEYYCTEIFKSRANAYQHGEKIVDKNDFPNTISFVETKMLISNE